MKNHIANLVNAIILIVMSTWAYFFPDTDNPSFTALIPAVIGLILIALNGGLKKENKVIAHIIVVLTFLIIIALIKPLMGAIEGEGRQLGMIRIGVMMISSIWAMFYFVKSFIEARKNVSK